jgi:hypothetical protein
MPQYKIIWNNDCMQRGYSVSPGMLELLTKISKEEVFRGTVTKIEQINPYPKDDK